MVPCRTLLSYYQLQRERNEMVRLSFETLVNWNFVFTACVGVNAAVHEIGFCFCFVDIGESVDDVALAND